MNTDEKDWLRKALIEASHDERLSFHVRILLMTSADQIAMREDIIATLTSQLAEAEDRELCAAAVAISLEKDLEFAEAKGIATGLETAAKVADDLCMDASGFTEEEHAYGVVAKAISALADQYKADNNSNAVALEE